MRGSRNFSYAPDYSGGRHVHTQDYNRGPDYNGGYAPDNNGGRNQQDSRREDKSRDNRAGKWGKKLGKKLKKGGDDGGDEVEFTIEAPPDGGTSAWVVCFGSSVLTSANSVVRTTLNESVVSVNEDFNQDRENYTSCYNGLTNNFTQIFGAGGNPQATECLSLGNPGFYDCMASYAATANSLPPEALSVYCPELYRIFASALSSFQGDTATDPTALQLVAGNIRSPPIPDDVDDIGSVMNFSFVCLSFICMLIAAVLSVFVGYRVVSIIGSILMAVGFIAASFLEEDQKVLAEILVGAVAGTGSAFVRYAAIVAILEYFDELRMRAIVISGLGAVLVNFLVIGLTFVDSIDFYWRKSFKFQAIPSGISLVVSLFMKPLKHKKSRDRGSRGNNSCSRKCSERICSNVLLKDVVLYLVILVFFLDQLGRPIFSEGMQPIMGEKHMSQLQIDIQPLIENGGSFLGLIGLLLWKTKSLSANLAVMATLDILIGLISLHVPEMTVFAWAAAYSALFGFTEGVFNSVIQDAIPEGFERRHIKMVTGILGFVAGVGTVVASFVGDVIDDRSDKSRVSYYFAGACLLTCGVVAIISRIVVVRRNDRDDDDDDDADEDIEFDAIGQQQRRY